MFWTHLTFSGCLNIMSVEALTFYTIFVQNPGNYTSVPVFPLFLNYELFVHREIYYFSSLSHKTCNKSCNPLMKNTFTQIMAIVWQILFAKYVPATLRIHWSARKSRCSLFCSSDLAIASPQWRLCGPLSQSGRSCFWRLNEKQCKLPPLWTQEIMASALEQFVNNVRQLSAQGRVAKLIRVGSISWLASICYPMPCR